jgi:hypothetical protein
MTGKASVESLRRLRADYNPNRSLRMGLLKIQFAVIMTWFEDFRDLPKPTLFADQPRDVPNERLSEDRHEIARLARAGMEHLEVAAMYAEKAMELHNRTEQPNDG